MKYGSSFSEIVFSLRGFGSSGLGVLREVSFSFCCRCGEYALIIERSAIGGTGTEYQNHTAKKSKFAFF